MKRPHLPRTAFGRALAETLLLATLLSAASALALARPGLLLPGILAAIWFALRLQLAKGSLWGKAIAELAASGLLAVALVFTAAFAGQVARHLDWGNPFRLNDSGWTIPLAPLLIFLLVRLATYGWLAWQDLPADRPARKREAPQSPRQPSGLTDVDLLVEQVVTGWQPRAWGQGHVDVIFQPEPGRRLTAVDSTRLEQVIATLVENGVGRTPPGGIVSVVITDDERTVNIEVRDSGDQIAAEELSRVWQPVAAAKEEGGTGLASARALAEGFGGRVAVESAAGTGARFSLRLPRAPHWARGSGG